MRKRTHRQQSARCSCMSGANAHREHVRPGKSVADHGNPFTGKKGCIHSELHHTTRDRKKQTAVKRLRFQ